MRAIKNFLHNINDIVLAVIIVALAAGIIYWRMQIILDYPKQLANEQAVYQEEAEETVDAAEAAAGEAEEAAAEAEAAEEQTEQPAEGEAAEEPQG